MTSFQYYTPGQLPPTPPATPAPPSTVAAGMTPAGSAGGLPPVPGAGELELVARPVWPTVLFTRKYRDHAQDAEDIIAHLYELKAKERENIASGIAPGMKSEHGLFESKLDLFETTQHPGLKRLVAFIESSIKRAVWHVSNRTVDPKAVKVEFRDSWFHITNGSGFHDAHTHGNCSWCGIYYLQISDVPETQPKHAPNGVNRFYRPLAVGGMVDDLGNAYLKHNVLDIPPIPGTLVLFPSYLLHSGLPYKGEKDRVILSFNSVTWFADKPGVGTGGNGMAPTASTH